MNNFQTFVEEILEDGHVDGMEALMFRAALFADGIIDLEEAEALLKINNVVTGKENDHWWYELFVDGLTAHLLKNEDSPGVITEEKAAWLIERLQEDGKLDDVEIELLKNLVEKATSIPASLTALLSE